MKKSKLIQILKTFSKDEIKEFEKFVKSPVSNCSKYILNFFLELKKHYPGFKDEDIEKPKIFSRLYKNKKYTDSTMRSMTSSLITKAEEYLTFKRSKADGFYADFCLLTELRLRQLNELYELKSRDMLKNLHEDSKMDLNNFLHDLTLHLELTGYKLYKDKTSEAAGNVKELGDSLMLFFMAYSTFVINYIQTLKTFYKQDVKSYINENFMKSFDYGKFIDSIEGDNSHRAQFMKINYYVYKLLVRENAHESFEKLRDLWLTSKSFLSDSMRKSFYDFLGNFCIVENRNSGSKYVTEFFNLSRIMLEDKLFLNETNVMQFNTYRQIFNHSLRLKEFDWAENFISEYSIYLTEEDKKLLMETAYSELAFEKGEFEKALDHLQKTNQGVRYLRLEIKELYIKIFYELKFLDSLYSAVDALRHYLSESNFSNQNINSSRNFLKYLTMYLNFSGKKKETELNILRNEVEKENNLHHKFWLLEKINSSYE